MKLVGISNLLKKTVSSMNWLLMAMMLMQRYLRRPQD
jgi:hypothetical protein